MKLIFFAEIQTVLKHSRGLMSCVFCITFPHSPVILEVSYMKTRTFTDFLQMIHVFVVALLHFSEYSL